MANEIGKENLYQGIVGSGNNKIFGWNSYSEVFNKTINEVRPQVILEVGTWLGASAIHMAKLCRKYSLNTKIFCVDTWLGAEEFWTYLKDTPERDLKLKNGYPQVYFEFLANVVEHNVQDMIVPVPNTSHIASIILKKLEISPDLIYIDGSHEYQDVMADLNDYYELLRPGGIIFGDDISWVGVSNAVRNKFKEYELFENNFWIVKKEKKKTGEGLC